MLFGEKVKSLRENLGMTQAELASKLGVSTRSVQFYEAENRYPKDVDKLSRLATALGVEPEQLMGEGDMALEQMQALYGYEGKRDAMNVLKQFDVLFAGGSYDDADVEKILGCIQKMYEVSKQSNKKYARKKKTEDERG